MSVPQSRSLARTGTALGAYTSLQPEDLAGEIDTALKRATEAMSRATNLLALALAPRVSGARLCHVELLTLHPTQLMYVFIISTGGVMKGVIDWPQPVDSGLVEWARTYLNETLNDHTSRPGSYGVRSTIRNSVRGRRPSCRVAGAGVRAAGRRAVSRGAVRRGHLSAACRVAVERRLLSPRSAFAPRGTVLAPQGAAGSPRLRHRRGPHRQ